MISKILFLNLFTCKGTYMIDWVGRFVHKSYVSLSQIVQVSLANLSQKSHASLKRLARDSCTHNVCETHARKRESSETHASKHKL